VLIDHLTDAVLQQHHELVEGIDLTLEFDAIDQVDGDGDAFLAERVQEWILQGLTSSHIVLPVIRDIHRARPTTGSPVLGA
jgi:hypothetical protein